MNYLDIQGFIQIYGLPAVIISLIVAIVSVVLDLIFKDKLFTIKSYLPFILATALMLLYDAIFGLEFQNTTEITSAGIFCGSFSFGIFAVYKRIRLGKKIKIENSCEILIIEGIISDIIADNDIMATAKEVLSYFSKAFTLHGEQAVAQNIAQILKPHCKEEITDEIIAETSNLIIVALTAKV